MTTPESKTAPVSHPAQAAAPQQQEPTYKFEFDGAAVNLLLMALDELPGKVGRRLREGLIASAQAQDAQRSAKPESPAQSVIEPVKPESPAQPVIEPVKPESPAQPVIEPISPVTQPAT